MEVRRSAHITVLMNKPVKMVSINKSIALMVAIASTDVIVSMDNQKMVVLK